MLLRGFGLYSNVPIFVGNVRPELEQCVTLEPLFEVKSTNNRSAARNSALLEQPSDRLDIACEVTHLLLGDALRRNRCLEALDRLDQLHQQVGDLSSASLFDLVHARQP